MANFTPQEIEEMLQAFFDTVGKRQYVGARYVPIFGRRGEGSIDWDNSAAYEPLTIVYYMGDTYTSKCYVPAGVDISDEYYWCITGRYNAQVEQYRQEVLGFSDRINGAYDAVETLRNEVTDDYVPFPNSITLPKYGTLGQVLTTLANGETKWENPVVPSPEQAEAAITEWLNDHPEATTTVEDGSITDAKISSSASIPLAFTKQNSVTDLKTLQRPGVYSNSSGASAQNLTDSPVSRNNYLWVMYVVKAFDGTFRYQIFHILGQESNLYIRITHQELDESITVYSDWKPILDEYLAKRLTAGVTALSQMTKMGAYAIPSTLYDTIMTPGNGQDFPAESGRTVYGLIVYSNMYNNGFSIQFLIRADGRIWFRTLQTSDGSVYYDWKLLFNSTNPPTYSALNGKKLVTAGDSYTAADFGTGNVKNRMNFGYYIAERNNMTFVNSGISGSIMALDKTYVADPDNVPISTRNPFSYQRYTQVPADTDYLTLWFGINDAAHTNLGTIDDATNETFYGAWNVVLEYYLTNRPFMHVGIVITTGSTAEYRQAVRDVAEKWGYPVLDLTDGTDTPAFFERDGMSSAAQTLRRNAYGWNTYSAHPNPEWHEFISSAFEEFLKRC